MLVLYGETNAKILPKMVNTRPSWGTKNNNNNNIIIINHIERRNSRFFTMSSLWHEMSPVVRALLCANHVQHIERLSHATWSMPHDTKGQLN